MTKHTTYRGVTIDMAALSREHEKTMAVGNMKVNARGDQINRGVVTKTADEIARENHRVKTAIVNTGLKGPAPSSAGIMEPGKSPTPTPIVTKPKKTKETELPSGDIVIEDE